MAWVYAGIFLAIAAVCIYLLVALSDKLGKRHQRFAKDVIYRRRR
jgi:hypothetical protein